MEYHSYLCIFRCYKPLNTWPLTISILTTDHFLRRCGTTRHLTLSFNAMQIHILKKQIWGSCYLADRSSIIDLLSSAFTFNTNFFCLFQNIKLRFLPSILHTIKHKEGCARSRVYFWGTTGHASRTDPPSHCPHWAEALVSQRVRVWKATLS